MLLYEEGMYSYEGLSQDVIGGPVMEAPKCTLDMFPLSDDEKEMYDIS